VKLCSVPGTVQAVLFAADVVRLEFNQVNAIHRQTFLSFEPDGKGAGGIHKGFAPCCFRPPSRGPTQSYPSVVC